MADRLETYVQDDYLSERQPLDEIERLTDDVLSVFASAFLKEERAWPYQGP